MELISDIVVISAALGAAFYCFSVSKQLKNLDKLDQGIGQAVTDLSQKTVKLKQSLESVNQETSLNADALEKKIKEAKEALDLLDRRMNDTYTKVEDNNMNTAISTSKQQVPSEVRAGESTPTAHFKRRFGPHGNS